MIEEGKIQIKALREIRGLTIRANQFVIADEMQNSSQAQVKDLLKRATDETKLVLTVATDDQLDRKAANWQQSDMLKFLEGLGKKFEATGEASLFYLPILRGPPPPAHSFLASTDASRHCTALYC